MNLAEAKELINYLIDNQEHWDSPKSIFEQHFGKAFVTPELVSLLFENFVMRFKQYDATAHQFQDAIYELVLSAIADKRCSDPVQCAKAAIKCSSVKFCRWYC